MWCFPSRHLPHLTGPIGERGIDNLQQPQRNIRSRKLRLSAAPMARHFEKPIPYVKGLGGGGGLSEGWEDTESMVGSWELGVGGLRLRLGLGLGLGRTQAPV